jgi:hydroxymethylpyrimidine pyrophosphatase-like HAD family hydrolase
VLDAVTILATDLDGTLLRRDGTISALTHEALTAAADAGIEVVVVTARPVRFLAEIDGLRTHGLAVCANGALVVDLESGATIAAHLLDGEAASAAVAVLRGLLPDVAFAVETVGWFGHEATYEPVWPPPPGSPIGPIESLTGDGVLKLLARHPEIHVDRLSELVAAIGAGATVTCSTSSGLVEIGPPSVTKASALEAVVHSLGRTAADVAAIGDMPNDLPMLRWAGVSAAVANAHADLLAAVDRIVPSNDDDGVAVLLEAIIATRP